MGFKQRSKNSVSGKSPSTEAMKKTADLATLNGGVTQDFAAHVENIRDTSKLLGYNVMKQGVTRNLLKYSEELNNSIWLKGATSIIVNDIIAPDGAMTGDKVISNVFPSGKCDVRQVIPITTNTTYTISAYFKSAEWTRVEFQILDSVPANLNIFPVFSISGKTQVTGGGVYPFTNVLIQDAPNDFVRISYTFTTPSVLTNVLLKIYPTPNNGTAGSYSGDGISGIYVWGVQLETGSQLTKYQPTQNTPIDSDYTAANLMYVPSSYGEGKNFSQNNLRNLLKFSEEFDNTIWTKAQTTISANTITAPNNTNSGDLFIEMATNTSHFIRYFFNCNPVITLTYSIFVKAKERDKVLIAITDNSLTDFARAAFNITTKQFSHLISAGNYKLISTNFEEYPNGWVRLLLTTITNSSTSHSAILYLADPNNDGLTVYQGDGTSGVYIWGAQLEQSLISTPYQRTTDDILDFNFTRTTSARVTNKFGIIEDSCYNLLPYSEQFDNAVWTQTNNQASVKRNIIIAPNGTLTGNKLVEDTSNNVHRIWIAGNSSMPTSIYTTSLYAKAAERTIVHFELRTPPEIVIIVVDLISGEIYGIQNAVNYGIIPYNDNWYRIWVTTNIPATVNNVLIYCKPHRNSLLNYQGDGVSGIYIWGAQLTQGLEPRQYLRTTNRLNVPKLEYTVNQRNMLKYSEEFDNSAWSKARTTVIPNQIIAPDGSLTGDKVVATLNTINDHAIFVVPSTRIIGGTYTLSIYAKSSEFSRLSVYMATTSFSNSIRAKFNLTTKSYVITNNTWLNPRASIIELNDGWFRLILTATGNNTDNTLVATYYLCDNNNSDGWTGDGISGINIWGAQLELGPVATPYAKTTNIPVSLNTEASLLIEPQRTNLLIQSEDFSQNSWTKTNVSVTPTINLNPFGINKSYYLIDDSTNFTHQIYTSCNITINNAYSGSYFIKKADDTWIQFQLGMAAFGGDWINFNFDTGLFGNSVGTATWNKKQLPNGWWLITFTKVAIVSGINNTNAIDGTDNTNTTERAHYYIGSGRKICEMSTIQLEQGSNATSYIPTTTVTVTRNAELNYVDLSNNNILNPDNFTLYIEGFSFIGSEINSSVALSNSTQGGIFQNDTLAMYSNIKGSVYKASSWTTVGSDLPLNSTYKFIIQRNGTNINFFRNGVQLGSTITAPVFNYKYLTVSTVGGSESTFTIDKITLFNRNLSDADCIRLTTL